MPRTKTTTTTNNRKVDLFVDEFVKFQITRSQFKLKPMNNVNYNAHKHENQALKVAVWPF